MKTFITNFKRSIKLLVVLLTSREFAFIYALLGTLTQIAHTWFLTSSISSFHGTFKAIQATGLSAFISSSLLYYVCIIDNSVTKENRNNKIAVNILTFIEILINLYYYSRHLIIDAPQIQIFDFIFAILISSFIPVMIKLYGSHIRAKEWFEDLMKEDAKADPLAIKPDANLITVDNEEKIKDIINKFFDEWLLKVSADIDQNSTPIDIDKIVSEKVSEVKNEIMQHIDKDVSGIFQKNQDLFLGQFENKIKLMTAKTLQARSLEQVNESQDSGTIIIKSEEN